MCSSEVLELLSVSISVNMKIRADGFNVSAEISTSGSSEPHGLSTLSLWSLLYIPDSSNNLFIAWQRDKNEDGRVV